ncbi:carbonic anhydrase [Streptomyces sp. 142MFCol3.1]|uniref:carbonic anhydrase n=1 Tax=Streptomyces sp. 142MFCol3.1 TaxID=1172179 RepID=UPI0003FB9FAC|nr:carbonic anhydrase [Streptomyces sp. 142MFCol3.1]
MQPLIDHARPFGRRPEDFAPLAHGQSPRVPFVTCSDSRADLALITGDRPGQLLEPRTAGDIVPPPTLDRPTAEAATVEYAVDVLGVRDVVVCDHSHCGAVAALARDDDLDAVPAVRDRLAQAEPLADAPAGDPAVAGAVQNHVLARPLRLRAHSSVRRATASGRLRLHGWYYEVRTAAVRAHRPETDTFEAL